ncbi:MULTISPECIES: hypothetical protein [unclassified Amycolatopsis]|nr:MULTISPECIES: hypothetical protein [unclassified Amycolatopsis]
MGLLIAGMVVGSLLAFALIVDLRDRRRGGSREIRRNAHRGG